ncbi:hypothetical protein OAF50_01105 [bacterium]|jgi:hypothetical protein|nr:hypothetical protein [bacterium]
MKKHKPGRGKIIFKAMVPDVNPVYERGRTIITGCDLSRNLPGDKPSDTIEDREEKLKGNEKLRAVYANAASALTVQFDGFKAKRRGTVELSAMSSPFDQDRANFIGEKPP